MKFRYFLSPWRSSSNIVFPPPSPNRLSLGYREITKAAIFWITVLVRSRASNGTSPWGRVPGEGTARPTLPCQPMLGAVLATALIVSPLSAAGCKTDHCRYETQTAGGEGLRRALPTELRGCHGREWKSNTALALANPFYPRDCP